MDRFVAHEDIAPTAEWVEEIERALRTCHALLALLHDGFRESQWCDQEVGYVYGRNRLVLTLRLDHDPHGFVSRFQAVNGRGTDLPAVAREIVLRLASNPKTSADAAEALVGHFYRSDTFAQAKTRVEMLQHVRAWTPALLDQLEAAVRENDQISEAWGVPGEVERILRQERGSYGPPVVDDELPF